MNTGQFVDTSRFEHIIRYFKRLENLDPRPMLEDWREIIVEDNRAGLLAGENRFGQIVTPPLKYRNGGGTWTPHRTGRFGLGRREGTIGGRMGRGSVPTRYVVKGGVYRPTHRGNQVGGLPNNNLRTSQYKKLTGPYGIPRGIYSRLITNFVVQIPQVVGERWTWVVNAGWLDIVDAKGRPFLRFLFRPDGRDMAGVRPHGVDRCRSRMIAYFREWIRYDVESRAQQ